MSAETLVSCFFEMAEQHPNRTALRVKRNGVYTNVLWGELAARVRNVAAWLIEIGVQPGDRVGILSENRQEWIEADFAILSIGAITVALHAPLTAAQVQEQFADADPAALFVSHAAQRKKLGRFRSFAPHARYIFAFDRKDCAPRTEDYAGLVSRPNPFAYARFSEFVAEAEKRIAAVRPDDVAAILYTSGTTGESKGVMLTHSNFISNIRSWEKQFPLDEDEETVTLLYLPLSHVYARTCDLYFGLLTGRVVALAECLETLAQDLQETRPHHISGVPRLHEKFAAAARADFEAGDAEALRRLLGGRIQYCGSGGAALSPDVARFYFDAGVPVYQGYGLTETSPVISFSSPTDNCLGAVGKPIADVEVKIAEDGEILTRGPHIMQGYWNRPEATAEAIDADGWFHTGDVGHLDEQGFLHITDRKKDLFVTAYGKNVAPQQIEGLLGFDPYIEQACIYGDGRKYLTALIVPAASVLLSWAEQNGLGGKSLDELLALPETQTLYEGRIAKALCNLAPYEQVRRFLLLPEPFSFAKGEMTVTAKLRRRQVVERYREPLEALYNEEG